MMNIETENASTAVALNGFPIITTNETARGMSAKVEDVTRYIANGSNQLEVSFSPTIVMASHDQATVGIELQRRIYAEDDYSWVAIASNLVGRGSVLAGSFNDVDNEIEFADLAGTKQWKFQFNSEDQYDGIPSEIWYFNASSSISNLSVSFLSTLSTNVVRYESLYAPDGNGELLLRVHTPSEGEAHLDETGFDMMEFSGSSTNPVTWAHVLMRRNFIETLFTYEFPPKDLLLDSNVVHRGELLKGSFDVNTLWFEGTNNLWEWEMDFSDEDRFSRIPGALFSYNYTSQIEVISAEFSNTQRTHVVTYTNVPLQVSDSGLFLDFVTASPATGQAWLQENDFQRVKLGCSSSNDTCMLANVVLSMRGRPVQDTLDLQIDVPYRWSWQDVVSIPVPLSTNDAIEIMELITAIHSAMSSQDIQTVTNLLFLRAKEISKVIDKSVSETAEMQADFFQNELFNSSHWGMTPLNETNIIFEIFNDGAVVHAYQKEKKYTLRSEEITSNSQPNRFLLDLYFSKLPAADGSNSVWKVIK